MQRYKTLKDHVYDFIADAMAIGTIETDKKINENKICEKLDISRTPVREALIQLNGEGVLENIPRKGFVVRHLTTEQLKQIYMIIGMLDGLAAKLAMPNMNEEIFSKMGLLISNMSNDIDSGNYSAYGAHQKAFHFTYIDECENTMLIETLEYLNKRIWRASYKNSSEAENESILHATNEEHKKILNLLKKGFGEEVEQYISHVHWRPENAYYDVL